jgi:hypothetical protein
MVRSGDCRYGFLHTVWNKGAARYRNSLRIALTAIGDQRAQVFAVFILHFAATRASPGSSYTTTP